MSLLTQKKRKKKSPRFLPFLPPPSRWPRKKIASTCKPADCGHTKAVFCVIFLSHHLTTCRSSEGPTHVGTTFFRGGCATDQLCSAQYHASRTVLHTSPRRYPTSRTHCSTFYFALAISDVAHPSSFLLHRLGET
jgi:hypothetical protein